MPQAAWFRREWALAQPALPSPSSFPSWLLQQAQKVTTELIEVEARSDILDAQDSASINNGREERVIHISIRRFQRKYAVAARHVPNSIRGPSEKRPAREISTKRLRILLEHFRRVPLGIDGNGNECDLGTEVRPELILNEGHHRRQNGTRIDTEGVDEGYCDDFATQIC